MNYKFVFLEFISISEEPLKLNRLFFKLNYLFFLSRMLPLINKQDNKDKEHDYYKYGDRL